VLNLLTLKYPLKEWPLNLLTGGFSVEIDKMQINWEEELQQTQTTLGK
jgi:hypothetical protein